MITVKDLQKIPLLSSLSQASLNYLVSCFSLQEINANEKLITEGDPAKHFYIIKSGYFDVLKKDMKTQEDHLLATLSQGEFLGEVSLFDTKRRSTSVKAKTKGLLYVISFENLKKFSKSYPMDYINLVNHISKRISRRMRDSNEITAASLSAQLETEKMRIKMANFIVLVITLLCIYSFMISFAASLVRALNTDVFISALVLIFVLIPTLLIIRYENYNIKQNGVNLNHWKKNITESVLFTLPILFLTMVAKLILIKTIPVLQADSLFSGVLITGRQYGFIFMLFYIASCPIQEFISRGVLQNSLQKFLRDHSYWLAIFVSNLIYSTLHLYLSFYYALATFIPGFYFGWLYARQKSLLGPTIAHILIGVWSIYILGVHTLIR